MKTSFKIYCLVLLFSFIAFSCSKEDDLIVKKTVQLKFENVESITTQTKQDASSFKVEIISTSPLKIKSADLVVGEAINTETGAKGYIITKKDKAKNSNYQTSANLKHAPIKRGYLYDGVDCFVYGTIYTADNGDQLFVAADAATQYLMNRCGYPNMV